MFKGRTPIVMQLPSRESTAHPGREAVLDLPRPFTKFKQEIRRRKEISDANFDSDRFRYTPSDRDARVQNLPHGVIAIHILELSNVSVRLTKFDLSTPIFFYCLISIGTTRRMSKVVKSDTKDRARMDSTVFFSIEVSDEREDYRNKLRLELWAFQEPEFHYIIGTMESHLYRIIQTIHGIEKKRIWSEGLVSGRIYFEYAFAYGAFGFGHSDQLKNTDRSVFEAVKNSMFPRIRMNVEDMVDNKFNVRIPTKLQVMSANSFVFETNSTQKYYTSAGDGSGEPAETVEPRYFTVHQVEFEAGFPVYCKVNSNIYQTELEADFKECFGEYVCLGTRRDRIDFLRSLVTGRLEDMMESDVGALFEDLEEGVVEQILHSDLYSGRKIYPDKKPCTEFTPVLLTKEDEPLLAKFPHTTWTPGWLARIFGYAEPTPTDTHYGEDDFPPMEIKEETKRTEVIKMSCTQKVIFRLRVIWIFIASSLYDFYHFLLPDLKTDREIPEISVTLPSPEGSTVDLYSRWVNAEIEHPHIISEKNAAQESNLLSIHQEKKVEVEDVVVLDDDDSENVGEEFQITEDDTLTSEDAED